MVKKYVTGLQHVGIPTNDIEKTVEFYTGLGFEIVWRSAEGAPGDKVAFLEMAGLTVETWQNGEACGKSGAIDHISLDVKNVDETFSYLKSEGYHLLNDEIQFLPFLKNGVRFFMIEGPNGEKIEFNQIL